MIELTTSGLILPLASAFTVKTVESRILVSGFVNKTRVRPVLSKLVALASELATKL